MKDNEYIGGLLRKICLYQDKTAYKELFVCLHKSLFQFANNITRSREDAEEIVSDVFIDIWQKRNALMEIQSPRMYFYTAIKNKSINRLASQKRQTAMDAAQWLTPMHSVYFDPEKTMITGEIMRNIHHAIQGLPPRCRIIFQLIKEDGLKYREVAELLEISIKTVESQMSIALRRIAQCMQIELPAK